MTIQGSNGKAQFELRRERQPLHFKKMAFTQRWTNII